jgi:single-strand DNA-binding protein
MTITGNLAGDPELRFTAAGQAVANYTVAQTPRSFDRNSQQWQDDETLWIRCTSWGEYAENVVATLTKGMRVIASGRLKARSFETKDGQQRTNWEMDIDEIGPSLRWATAQVQRVQRNGNGGAPAGGATQWPAASQSQSGGFGQPAGQSQGGGFGPAPTGGNAWDGGGGSWDQGNDSPPPF